jgi:hypothetical protein
MARSPSPHRGAADFILLACALALGTSGAGGQPPAQPPKKPAEVPAMRLVWEVEPRKAMDGPRVLFDPEGKLVVLTRFNSIEALSFSARTGKVGPELFPAPDLRASNAQTIPLEKGKFAFQPGSSLEKEFVVWDALSGKTARFPIPQISPGIPSLSLSANARYLAVGGRGFAKGGKSVERPARVFDDRSNKTVVATDWENGTAHFTAGAARVLLHDAGDRFRWFRLPSGQPDGEWNFGQEAARGRGKVLALSADGAVILFSGQPPRRGFGVHLLDGNAGDVLHSFTTRSYFDEAGFLSPDGSSVVLVRSEVGGDDVAELLDARGTPLGRLTLPGRGRSARHAPVDVCWETRSLATYDFGRNRLSVHDLPGSSAPAAVVSRVRPGARAPVPGDAALVKAEIGVREVLKAEYDRRPPAERRALAEKLIALAGQTADDPAARFVMLRDARDLAVELADPALAARAVDALAAEYELDGPVQLLAALGKILNASSNATVLKVVAESAGPEADAAAAADEFDEAVQFAQLAAAAARKGKLGPGALEEADYRLARAKKERDSFAAVRPAVEKLAANPDDREANTALGKYRCFVQGRWDAGLRHLARGANGALRDLAEIDLKAPRTGVADVQVADSWWEYAQAAPADEQWGVQTRTRYWYGRCLPGLAGLNKVKAENRLAFTFAGVEYRPGLVCELSAKLPSVPGGRKARLDPVIDFSGGEFSEGARQTELAVKWSGFLAPPLAGRYELAVTTSERVRVRVDGKVVIDTASGKPTGKDAAVVLGERPVQLVVDLNCPNTDRGKLKLTWRPPGAAGEEPVPAECLFHDRKTATVLGK